MLSVYWQILEYALSFLFITTYPPLRTLSFKGQYQMVHCCQKIWDLPEYAHFLKGTYENYLKSFQKMYWKNYQDFIYYYPEATTLFQWLMFLSLIDILLTCVSIRTFLCILLLLFSLYFLLYFCLGLQNEKFSILCVIVNLFNILWIILYDIFFASFLGNFPKVNNTSNFHQGRAYPFSHQ